MTSTRRRSMVWHGPNGPSATAIVVGAVGMTGGAAALIADAIGVINGSRFGTLLSSSAIFAFGWAVRSSGSMSRGSLKVLSEVARITPVVLLSTPVWLLTLYAEYSQLPRPRSTVPIAVGVFLFIGLAVWRRLVAPPLRSRTRVSAALAVALAMYLFAGFGRMELYPFSPFRMYSGLRLDPFFVELPVVVADVAGEEISISTVLGSATVRALVTSDDHDRVVAALETLADAYERRTGREIDATEVRRQIWFIPEHPGELEATLVREELVLRHDG